MELPAITFIVIAFLAPTGPSPCSVLVQSLRTEQNSASYPDSEHGLQQMMQDLLSAMRQKDYATLNAMRKSMVIPNFEAWFRREFGEQDGSKLAALYAKEVAEWDSHLDDVFDRAAELKDSDIQVKRIGENGNSYRPIIDVFEAMREKTSLSDAKVADPHDPSAPQLGYYFYIESGFRFADPAVLSALSAVRPLRLPVGGNVMKSELIHQVLPTYPPHAKSSRGKVVLHMIVAVDGSIKELKAVSGPDDLAASALDAVRQWRYRTILLNGWPVEVDTTVEISFDPGR